MSDVPALILAVLATIVVVDPSIAFSPFEHLPGMVAVCSSSSCFVFLCLIVGRKYLGSIEERTKGVGIVTAPPAARRRRE
jgi:hypothetical protein